MGRWEAPYELLCKSYEDGMAYYGELKKEGKLVDMTMAEFADFSLFSKERECFMREHYKLLIEENAVNTIKKYCE